MSRLYAVMAWVTLSGAGCASQLSMVKSDNSRLRAMVTELRADKRRAERRVRELEGELALTRDGTAPAGQSGAPVLPVEVMAPPAIEAPSDLAPGQRIVGIADDGTAIIYEGDAAIGTSATWGDDEPAPPPRARSVRAPDPADRVPATGDRIPSMGAAPAAAPARDVAADRYRSAVDLLRAGEHDAAIAGFRDVVKRFPEHDLADNAQYWIGEAFYSRKDYAQALAEFRLAVDKYPRGNKVPDALLKVGYCHQALGQTDKARFALEQVMTIYPKTPPASLAEKRLETLGP